MSIELLERAAAALGEELRRGVVFVGAATLQLWIDDPAAPPLRPTKDVDVVLEVSTLVAYNRFEQRLRQAGFRDDGRAEAVVLQRIARIIGDDDTHHHVSVTVARQQTPRSPALAR